MHADSDDRLWDYFKPGAENYLVEQASLPPLYKETGLAMRNLMT